MLQCPNYRFLLFRNMIFTKQSVIYLLCIASTLQCSPAIFYIEGNTGTGKTTILHALAKKHPEVIVLEEPVTSVQNVQGINALELMYEDQKRWALTVNLLYYVFHIQQLQLAMESNPDGIIISDRSLFSGIAFCNADAAAGVLHPLEPILYKKLSHTTSSLIPKPRGIIYMRANPEVSFQRICTRSRKEEAHITSNYWEMLHEGHEHMLLHNKPEALADVPILVIDCNQDMHANPDFVSDTIVKIEQFMKTCIAQKK